MALKKISDRRVHPIRPLSLDERAQRAVGRFQGNNAEDIKTAVFREQGSVGESLRSKVRRLLREAEGLTHRGAVKASPACDGLV